MYILYDKNIQQYDKLLVHLKKSLHFGKKLPK